MVVAQLVVRSPLTPEIHGSNPVIGKLIFTVNCVEKANIKKKRPGMAHFVKTIGGFFVSILVWSVAQWFYIYFHLQPRLGHSGLFKYPYFIGPLWNVVKQFYCQEKTNNAGGSGRRWVVLTACSNSYSGFQLDTSLWRWTPPTTTSLCARPCVRSQKTNF